MERIESECSPERFRSKLAELVRWERCRRGCASQRPQTIGFVVPYLDIEAMPEKVLELLEVRFIAPKSW